MSDKELERTALKELLQSKNFEIYREVVRRMRSEHENVGRRSVGFRLDRPLYDDQMLNNAIADALDEVLIENDDDIEVLLSG